MDDQIIVNNVSKVFKVTDKTPGVRGAVRSIICPHKKIVKAIDHITFSIKKGEIVGLLGANGAGKSTVIKMLCGILYPTEGEIQINGFYPYRQRKKIVRNIGAVFGQRSQLFWELRLGESFELQRIIYDIPLKDYKNTLNELDDILHFSDFLNKPVRQLSLGQRMRGDFAAAMLHKPDIVFLDEPTIGLDTQTKYAIRDFIRTINKTYGTTVLITTHDMGDIEALCNRLIVLHNGKIMEDGELSYFKNKFSPYRKMMITIGEKKREIPPCGGVVFEEIDDHVVTACFKQETVSSMDVLAHVSECAEVIDMTIKEPGMDDVMLELER